MAGERRRFEVEVTRRPLSALDSADDEAVRAFLLACAEEQIRHTGGAAAGFRFFTADTHEWAETGAPDPGDERFHATCFRQLGQRPGVVRRVREGEARVAIAGSHRRAAVVLEWQPPGDAWWLAWRLIGEREGQVGVFFGDWVVSQGTGVETLPEPFREWLEGEPVESARVSHRPGELNPGELLFGATRMAAPAPDDPVAVLDLMAPLANREILENGLRGLQVFAFEGVVAEHYLFLGRLDGTLDDVVRNVASRGNPDAVVVVFAGVAAVGGEDRRSVMAVVELRDGRRAHRVIPVVWDAAGNVHLPRAWTRPLPPAEPGDRWLGVPPALRFDLSPLPLAGGPIAEG